MHEALFIPFHLMQKTTCQLCGETAAGETFNTNTPKG